MSESTIGWGQVEGVQCPECNSDKVTAIVNKTAKSELHDIWTRNLTEMGIMKPSYFKCNKCKHKWGDENGNEDNDSE